MTDLQYCLGFDSGDEICARALDKWGFQRQLITLYEELGELMQAMSKYTRHGEGSLQNVKEEMADVYIMLRQMEIACFITDEDRDAMIDAKLSMLKQKIERIP